MWAFHNDDIIALYCSDVSGAFDRVNSDKLLSKLERKGVCPTMLKLLQSWLDERIANVVVEGCQSTPATIKNMVYQGTVWGPPLWNAFFEDARRPVSESGFSDLLFADDLNSFKTFNKHVSHDDIYKALKLCQKSLHGWGDGNQVAFDPLKESFHLLHAFLHLRHSEPETINIK